MPDRLVVLPQHSEIDRCRDAWRADGLLRVVSEMLPNCSATVSVSITGLPCRPRNDLGSIRQHENVSSPPEIPSVNAAVWGLDAHSSHQEIVWCQSVQVYSLEADSYLDAADSVFYRVVVTCHVRIRWRSEGHLSGSWGHVGGIEDVWVPEIERYQGPQREEEDNCYADAANVFESGIEML